MNVEKSGHITDLVPAYLNGTLEEDAAATVHAHLAFCPACRAEAAFWQEISAATRAAYQEIDAPANVLLDRVWATVDAETAASPAPSAGHGLHWLVQLLGAQMPLVRCGIWAASALTMALGCALELIASYGAGKALALIAPIVAAMGIAFVYGPESDPGLELALATPTSPRFVLLARLTLIYAYDILLALTASVVTVIVRGGAGLWPVIVLWLGPMLFLSALSLVLALLFGSGVGIAAALALWCARVMTFRVPWHVTDAWGAALDRFWRDDALLIPLAAALLLVAVLSLSRQERFTADVHVSVSAS
jgi:Putative zinc-finger